MRLNKIIRAKSHSLISGGSFLFMEKLKKKAIALGACQEGIDRWSDDIVGMYRQGISWCMDKQFPSFDDMRKYDKILSDSHIYNLKYIELPNFDSDTCVLNGCIGYLGIGDYSVSRVYIGRDSVIDIDVLGNSYMTIDIYDTSVVKINVADTAKCVVWQYGESTVQVIGNAKIVKK